MRLKYFQNLLITCSWLSLDVVLGAIVCNIMVFHFLEVSPIPYFQSIILGLTVWLIYISDHLWDVKKIEEKITNPRRYFYYKNYVPLKIFAFFSFTFISIFSLLFLPLKTIMFGMYLGFLVGLYLFIIHYYNGIMFKKWFHKEILVGLLYSIGIWGSAGILAKDFELVHWLVAANFIMIAIQNLMIFSLYEKEEDIHQKQQSIVQVIGSDQVKRLVLLFSFLIIIAGGIIIVFFNNALAHNWVFLELIMTFILSCITIFPEFFKRNFAYRWLGDGVFILPSFLWFGAII